MRRLENGSDTMRVTLVEAVRGFQPEPHSPASKSTTKHNIKMFKVIKKGDSQSEQPTTKPSTTHHEPRARRKKSWWCRHKQKSKSEERVGRNGRRTWTGADQGELKLRNNNNNQAERWERGMSGDEDEGVDDDRVALAMSCRAEEEVRRPEEGECEGGRRCTGVRPFTGAW